MTMNIMNYLANIDKNSKFLLIIIAVIVVLLIIITILNFTMNKKNKPYSGIQKVNKRKLFKEIEEESKNIDPSTFKSNRKPKTVEKIEKVIEPKVEAKNIDQEPEILEDEIIEIIQEDNESDVDRILRDIKSASKEETLNLTDFEKEQEETAIISYDELCKKAGVQKIIYKAPEKEHVKQEIKKEQVVQKTQAKEEPKQKSKYTPTKFVSPIYGVQQEKKVFIDVSDDVEELDLDQTFLKNLKEFRSGLE
ncbi:MAG: hypothetical protein IJH20_04820 [Bacilli bacterium]|nr:hypothetical protein [Bacilli bacterium]